MRVHRTLLLAVLLAGCEDETIAPDEPPPNRHPVLMRGIPAQTLWHGATRVDMDLTGAFSDPDGDALTYTVASSDTTIVPVALHPGPVLSLAGPLQGEATLTLTARDPEGLEAQATFPVAVVENPDRATLEAVTEATGGETRRWDNWLTDAPLGDWYGIGVNEAGRVSCLGAYSCSKREGISLPHDRWSTKLELPQLGDLEALEELALSARGLRIPPELGKLSHLWHLSLSGIAGKMPPELGNLRNLRVLNLSNHGPDLGIPIGRFEGPIPSTLGNLTKLENLVLRGAFKGSIPPELGKLTNLKRLQIEGSMTGPVPAEIGNLSELGHLRLAGLHLSGPLPPELQNLKALSTRSAEYDGPNYWNYHYTGLYIGSMCRIWGYPASGQRIRGLPEICDHYDADLCVPSESMRQWLTAFYAGRSGANYGGPLKVPGICDGAMQAHLTQAVQTREPTVPLVAGEPAALRLFGMSPPLQARFYLNGGVVHTAEIASIAFDAGTAAVVPATGFDSNDASAEALIPGHLVRPGLEFVVEGDGGRFPAKGRQGVDVREVPPFSLTVVPLFLEYQGQRSFPDADSQYVAIADSMAAADPPGDYWRLSRLVDELPVGAIRVAKHPPVVLNQDTLGLNYGSLRVVGAVRAMSGGTGHWMGLGQLLGPVCCPAGVAYRPGVISVVKHPNPGVIAHELGHNFNLGHSDPPSDPLYDSDYPHPQGRIGAWGYHVPSGTHIGPGASDMMGQTGGSWISGAGKA